MSEQVQVAKIEARLDEHDRRIGRAEEITEQIHKLTASVENLAAKVGEQGERIEKIVSTFDERLEKQGLRIGAIETKGSKKLDGIFTAVATAVVTAALMYFMAM